MTARTLLLTTIFVAGLAGFSGAATSRPGNGAGQPAEIAQQAGTSTLTVSGSIKTHTKRYHFFESRERGTEGYLMEIEIGGQTHRVTATPREETPKNADRRHPEYGSGIRYDFQTELFVPSGTHQITVRLPAEGVSVSKEVTLVPGKNTLRVTPAYRKVPRDWNIGFKGDRHFSQHVESLKLSTE